MFGGEFLYGDSAHRNSPRDSYKNDVLVSLTCV